MTFGTYLTVPEQDVLNVCETLSDALFGRASGDQEALG